MDRDFGVPDIETLEYHNLFCFQRGSVKGKGHIYGAAGLIRREGCLSGDFLIAYQHRLAGGLIHEGSFEGELLTYSEILIFHCIHDGGGCGEGEFLLAIRPGCRCSDLRFIEADRLTFILDVRMDGDLPAVVQQAFENNHALGFQGDGVEGEGYRDGAVRRFRGESSFCRDGLAVNLNRFAGSLVHELPLQGVLLAGLQAHICYGVHDHGFRRCIQRLFAIFPGCRGPDLRVQEDDGLIHILDVGVGGDLLVREMQGFKNHHSLSFESGSVKGEFHGGAAGLPGGTEGFLRRHLIFAHHEGFLSGLVHENALECILGSGLQPAVVDGIHDGYLLGGIRRIAHAFLFQRGGEDFGDGDIIVRQGSQIDHGVMAIHGHLKGEQLEALVGLAGQFFNDVVIVEERAFAVIQHIQFPEPYAIPVGLTGIGVLAVGVPFGCCGKLAVYIGDNNVGFSRGFGGDAKRYASQPLCSSIRYLDALEVAAERVVADSGFRRIQFYGLSMFTDFEEAGKDACGEIPFKGRGDLPYLVGAVGQQIFRRYSGSGFIGNGGIDHLSGCIQYILYQHAVQAAVDQFEGGPFQRSAALGPVLTDFVVPLFNQHIAPDDIVLDYGIAGGHADDDAMLPDAEALADHTGVEVADRSGAFHDLVGTVGQSVCRSGSISVLIGSQGQDNFAGGVFHAAHQYEILAGVIDIENGTRESGVALLQRSFITLDIPLFDLDAAADDIVFDGGIRAGHLHNDPILADGKGTAHSAGVQIARGCGFLHDLICPIGQEVVLRGNRAVLARGQGMHHSTGGVLHAADHYAVLAAVIDLKHSAREGCISLGIVAVNLHIPLFNGYAAPDHIVFDRSIRCGQIDDCTVGADFKAAAHNAGIEISGRCGLFRDLILPVRQEIIDGRSGASCVRGEGMHHSTWAVGLAANHHILARAVDNLQHSASEGCVTLGSALFVELSVPFFNGNAAADHALLDDRFVVGFNGFHAAGGCDLPDEQFVIDEIPLRGLGFLDGHRAQRECHDGPRAVVVERIARHQVIGVQHSKTVLVRFNDPRPGRGRAAQCTGAGIAALVIFNRKLRTLKPGAALGFPFAGVGVLLAHHNSGGVVLRNVGYRHRGGIVLVDGEAILLIGSCKARGRGALHDGIPGAYGQPRQAAISIGVGSDASHAGGTAVNIEHSTSQAVAGVPVRQAGIRRHLAHRNAAGGFGLRLRFGIRFPGGRGILPAYEGLVGAAACVIDKGFKTVRGGRQRANNIRNLYQLPGEVVFEPLECVQAAHVGVAGHGVAHTVCPIRVGFGKYLFDIVVAGAAVQIVTAFQKEIIGIGDPVVDVICAGIEPRNRGVDTKCCVTVGCIHGCVIPVPNLITASGMLHLGGAGRIAKGEQPHPGRFRVSGDGNIAAQGGCLDIQDAIFNRICALREVDAVLGDHGVAAILQRNGDLIRIGGQRQGMGFFLKLSAHIYANLCGYGDIRHIFIRAVPVHIYFMAPIPCRQVQRTGGGVILGLDGDIQFSVQSDFERIRVHLDFAGEQVGGDSHTVTLQLGQGMIGVGRNGRSGQVGGSSHLCVRILEGYRHQRFVHYRI